MSPTSALIELQREATSERASLVAVMEKAYDYAVENDLHELETWLYNELNGYPDTTITPWYRRLSGTLLAEMSFSGWHPIEGEGDDFKRHVTTFTCRLPIAEIVTYHECKHPIWLPFTSDEKEFLSETVGIGISYGVFLGGDQLKPLINQANKKLLLLFYI
ncbi:AbiTii domain-containing protein [Salinivibrio sp. IB643]|uniref:AbiTii domain-containing protein n=1 Tax=Salinivibrio sp. IB643 TaxID=1909445 RepID=UPI000988976D|nr:hypothetical protein [Salinivibrio sp. IB643]OOE92700.1 hypothetical protein BZG77_14560 [Salinivibrio sp. IB643]